MDNNINFKALWSEQKVASTSSSQIIEKISSFKKKNLRRIILTNIALVLTSTFIIFVWIQFQPEFLSTKLGIVLCILAMTIYLLVYNKSFSLFQSSNEDLSNQNYLAELKRIKEKQHFLQTTMLNVYFILLSSGLALYMYEYAARMTVLWALISYGITGAWIALNWFYFRPKQIKKQTTELQEIIGKLEEVQGQLES